MLRRRLSVVDVLVVVNAIELIQEKIVVLSFCSRWNDFNWAIAV
jgi:hypothetical protein